MSTRSPIILLGREQPDAEFSEHKDNPFTTYRAAIIAGQRDYGYGMFMITTGDRVPSRDEQLGLGRSPSKSRKQQLLDQI